MIEGHGDYIVTMAGALPFAHVPRPRVEEHAVYTTGASAEDARYEAVALLASKLGITIAMVMRYYPIVNVRFIQEHGSCR